MGASASRVWADVPRCLAASLLLAVWSPLVLMPACLALVIAVQQRKAILASRGAALVWLVATTGQLVAYGLGVVLPGLLHLRGFLKVQGDAYVFPRSAIVIIGVALIVLSFVAFRSLRSAEWTAILAMVAASALGLAALLFVTRHEPDPWPYYPLKFSWMALVLLLVLLVGVVPSALAPLFRRAVVRYAAIALVTATAVTILAAAPPSDALHEWSNPIKWILNGEVSGRGDAVSETILRDADLEYPHVFWQSKAPQQDFINFWLLEIAANSMTKSNDLRVFAYGVYDETKVRDLCSIMKLMGGAVTVVTANPNLESGDDGACSTLRAEVVVRSWP